MFIYLVRHAIAVERGTPGFSDEARPLTPKGRQRMKEIVRGLGRLNVAINEVWTSPLVRARQTAEVFAGQRGFDGAIRDVESLSPGGDAVELLALIRAAAGIEGLALVGHEPDLGELCGRLVTGNSDSIAVFKKGSVACLKVVELEPSIRTQLLWLMQPRELRYISRCGN